MLGAVENNLPDAERHQLLVAWNDTAAAYPAGRGVHHLVADQAADTPEAVAVVGPSGPVTYAELEAAANRLANHLVACGVGPEVVVGLCVERDVPMVVALLGVLKAGGAYVPLDPDFPASRLELMVADSGTAVVVADDHLVGCLPASYGGAVVRLGADAGAIAACSPTAPEVAFGPEQLAYVLYTSGSTGRPKGVEVPHRAVVNFLWSMAARPGLGAGDVLVAVTTLSFDIAVLELYLPLVVGARVVVASREAAGDPSALAEVLERHRATAMQATPTTWRMLLDAGWGGRDGLKALCGGEALAPALADRLVGAGLELWNLYGPTETTVWSTLAPVEGPGWRPTIGSPIANTVVYVLDGAGQPVPVGVAGELYIGGDGLARGYRGRPELTAERFVESPFEPGRRLYRTGDLVRWRPDATLEFLGRIDNQVKVRGFRIELGEVEAALADHPAVSAAVVVAREDVPGDVRLVGYVVCDDGADHSSEFRQTLQARLPPYMVPSAFITLRVLPLTPNGKLDRNALPVPDLQGDERSYVAPRSKEEKVLAEIWAEVLRVDRVGVTDDFFELGGHSLLATQVVALTRERAAAEIPVRAVFQAPTLAELAEVVAAAAGQPTLPPLVAVDRSLFRR